MMSETMQATTASPGRRATRSPRRRAQAALGAEWIKLRSLRSMLVTLALAAVFCIGYADLLCWRFTLRWHTFDAASKGAFNPLDTNLNDLVIGVLFIGVIARGAAVAMTSVFGAFVVIESLLNSLHGGVWQHTVPYLPSNLGNALWLSHARTGSLVSPAGAALGLAAYIVVLGVVATFSLRSRDA
jgi:hypothetical protein